MKVEVKTEEKKFEPIELTITIESEEELCSLWHRMNALNSEINPIRAKDVLKHKCENELNDLFKVLDKLAKQRNLYK